jgi:predicted nucleic-acid-binding protein
MAEGASRGARGARCATVAERVIVDANVLLRSLDRAGGQAAAVRARVKNARATGERLIVLSATVLEVAYVLESAAAGYGWEREQIAQAVEAIVEDPAFAVEHAHALRAAAATYRERSIDLHDCLLSAVATERGLKVLSFDDDLRRLGTSERP